MADVRDLVTASLREIGVLAGGEVAPYEDANDAFDTLNRLVDQWAAERLLIFSIGRYEFDITANVGEYELGSSPSVIYSTSATDGFDSTWTGTPPGWTLTTTLTGTIANETTVVQAGGHAVKLSVPTLGVAQIHRDFTTFSGTSATLSVYIRGDGGGDAAVLVQCVETEHYLTSTGAWQAASAQVFTRSAATYAQSSITFTVEDLAVVGADTATLRITLYTDSFTANGYFDTFSLTNTDTSVIVPTIVIPRPVYIDHVNLMDTAASPDLETPLGKLTDDGWARVSQKDLTSTQPSAWYYNPSLPGPTFSRNPTFPFGTLNLWPVPTGSNLKGVIYMPTQITQFSSLDSLISLPPGYERMMVKNLALELCPTYDRQPSPALVRQAETTLSICKRSNKRSEDMSFPAASLFGTRGGYDIRTDQ